MVKVTIENTSYLQRMTKTKNKNLTINIEEKNSLSIYKILEEFTQKYGKEAKKQIFKNGQIKHTIFIFLNNTLIPWSKLSEVTIKSGDKISIIPAVAGG
jgi:molybdopterin converting factor small subunit